VRFAYADPPYFENGKRLSKSKQRYLGLHDNPNEYDSKNKHYDLIDSLMSDYPDGWAMSCNPKDLSWLLPHLPEDIRICAWAKTFHQIRVNVSVQYAWEPLLLYRGRDMRHRRPMTRDWVSCRIAMKKGLSGAKPEEFYSWLLDIIGYENGDEMHDLFPGTGGLHEEINKRLSGLM